MQNPYPTPMTLIPLLLISLLTFANPSPSAPLKDPLPTDTDIPLAPPKAQGPFNDTQPITDQEIKDLLTRMALGPYSPKMPDSFTKAYNSSKKHADTQTTKICLLRAIFQENQWQLVGELTKILLFKDSQKPDHSPSLDPGSEGGIIKKFCMKDVDDLKMRIQNKIGMDYEKIVGFD